MRTISTYLYVVQIRSTFVFRVTSLSRILSLLVFAALTDFATVGVPKRATKAASSTQYFFVMPSRYSRYPKEKLNSLEPTLTSDRLLCTFLSSKRIQTRSMFSLYEVRWEYGGPQQYGNLAFWTC